MQAIFVPHERKRRHTTVCCESVGSLGTWGRSGEGHPMRGKIEVLGAGALQGRIRAEDGSRIPFDLSGILAYDVGRLCVGHSVTFDVDKRASTAINVSREQETTL